MDFGASQQIMLVDCWLVGWLVGRLLVGWLVVVGRLLVGWWLLFVLWVMQLIFFTLCKNISYLLLHLYGYLRRRER